MIPNRRASRVGLICVAVTVCAISAVLILASSGWIDSEPVAPPRQPPAPGTSGAYVPDATGAGPSRESSEDGREVFGITLPAAAEDAASDDEPAALPAPPGGERLMRSSAPFNGGRIDSSVWRVADGDPARLASFYERAAEAEGFKRVRRTIDDRSGAHRRRMRRNGQWLHVDCRPARDGVRVVVQLR